MDRTTPGMGKDPRQMNIHTDRGLVRRVVQWFADFHGKPYEEAHRLILEHKSRMGLIPDPENDDLDGKGESLLPDLDDHGLARSQRGGR